MRILVADDEAIVIEGLTHIISNYNSSYEIETAHSGREAIQTAERFHPDVVFMDIKMPGIDGLEALEEIHRILPQAILVVVSAYEQFTYAQSAINLQVLEYLVKPVHKERLLNVLKRIESLLSIRSAERQKSLGLREKYQKLLPLFEKDFIYRLITGIDRENLELYRELLDPPPGSYSFMLVRIRTVTPLSGEDRVEADMRISQEYTAIGQSLRQMYGCLLGPAHSSPFAILLATNEPDEYKTRLKTIAVAEYILERLPADFSASIGIGGAYPWLPELGRSYQEALMALSSRHSGPILHYMDIFGSEQPEWELQLDDIEEVLLNAVVQGRPEKVQAIFSERLFPILQHPIDDIVRVSQRIWESGVLALREARKHGFEEEPGWPSSPSTMSTSEEIQQQCFPRLLNLFVRCAMFIRDERTYRLNSVVHAAKAYIDENYQNEDLYLENIAKQACVSPYYLSRLFHTEMGITLTDYLTKVRLEKAVSLLEQGISIKEVCYQVGYSDPNYFSRLFRKVYGMPPTEYRRKSEG